MKILLVTEFFPTGKGLRFSGGVEARTYFVAKHLAKKHQVIVICSRQPHSKKLEILDRIKVYRVGSTIDYQANAHVFSFLSWLRFIIKANKLGAKLSPEIVDGGNFVGNFIAKQISLKNKIPVVFWYPDVFIGQWIKTSGMLSGIAGFILERFNFLRFADQFIAISQIVANKLIKNGVAKNKIKMIPCGVDLSEFKPSRAKFSKPSIICIARLVSYKRIEDLIWAFALLVKKNQNLKLTIVGRGPEEKELKNIAIMLKINRKVSFLNNLPRKDLIRTIKSSHIFCLPSEVEGFGISIIEAAAAGIPYVISDIPVFREVTKNGHGGLIFKLGDIKDLSSKIGKLLTDRNLYAKKSKEALLLSQNYQWSQIAKQTEGLYKSLISKNIPKISNSQKWNKFKGTK